MKMLETLARYSAIAILASAGLVAGRASGQPNDVSLTEVSAEEKKIEEAGKALESHVKVVNGHYVLEAPAGALSGIDKASQDGVQNALKNTNKLIDEGKLKANADGTLTPVGASVAPETPEAVAGEAAVRKRGGTRNCKWWRIPNCHYYLTRSQNSTMLNGASATATLLSPIVGGWIGAGVGAVANFVFNQLKDKMKEKNLCGILGFPLPPVPSPAQVVNVVGAFKCDA